MFNAGMPAVLYTNVPVTHPFYIIIMMQGQINSKALSSSSLLLFLFIYFAKCFTGMEVELQHESGGSTTVRPLLVESLWQ